MRSLLLPIIALAATGVSAHEGHDHSHDHAQVVEDAPKASESLTHSFTVSCQLIPLIPSVDSFFASYSPPKSRLRS